MSQQNVQTITRDDVEGFIAALNAKDFAAVQALPHWHPEMEFHSVLAVAEGGVFRGIEGLRKWAETIDETWADFRLEVVDVRRVSDETFVVVCRGSGRARGSGVPLQSRTGQVWSVRDGKVWRNVVHSDARDALKAVGLPD